MIIYDGGLKETRKRVLTLAKEAYKTVDSDTRFFMTKPKLISYGFTGEKKWYVVGIKYSDHYRVGHPELAKLFDELLDSTEHHVIEEFLCKWR